MTILQIFKFLLYHYILFIVCAYKFLLFIIFLLEILSPIGRSLIRFALALYLREILIVHLSDFLLDFPQICLLFLVIHLPLSLPILVCLQIFLYLLRLSLQSLNTSYQILIDIFFNNFPLIFINFFHGLNFLQKTIDLLINRSYHVINTIQLNIRLIILLLAFECLDRPFVELNLLITILQLSS